MAHSTPSTFFRTIALYLNHALSGRDGKVIYLFILYFTRESIWLPTLMLLFKITFWSTESFCFQLTNLKYFIRFPTKSTRIFQSYRISSKTWTKLPAYGWRVVIVLRVSCSTVVWRFDNTKNNVVSATIMTGHPTKTRHWISSTTLFPM